MSEMIKMVQLEVLLVLFFLIATTADEAHNRRRLDPEADLQEKALDDLANDEDLKNSTENKAHGEENSADIIAKTRKRLEEEIEKLLDSLTDQGELDILEQLDEELTSETTGHHADPWNSKILESQLEQWVAVAERLEQDHSEQELMMSLNGSDYQLNDTENSGIDEDMKEIEELEKNMTQEVEALESQTTVDKQKENQNQTDIAEDTTTAYRETNNKQNAFVIEQNITKSEENNTLYSDNGNTIGNKTSHKGMEDELGSGNEDFKPHYDKELMDRLKNRAGKDSDGIHKHKGSDDKSTKTPTHNQLTHEKSVTSGKKAQPISDYFKYAYENKDTENAENTGITDNDYISNWDYKSHNNLQPEYDLYQYPEEYPDSEPDIYYPDVTESNYPDDENYFYYQYNPLINDEAPDVKGKSSQVAKLPRKKPDRWNFLGVPKSGHNKLKPEIRSRSSHKVEKQRGKEPEVSGYDFRGNGDSHKKLPSQKVQSSGISKEKTPLPNLGKSAYYHDKYHLKSNTKKYKHNNPDVKATYPYDTTYGGKKYKYMNPDDYLSNHMTTRYPDVKKAKIELKHTDKTRTRLNKYSTTTKAKSHKPKYPDVKEKKSPKSKYPDNRKSSAVKSKLSSYSPISHRYVSRYPGESDTQYWNGLREDGYRNTYPNYMEFNGYKTKNRDMGKTTTTNSSKRKAKKYSLPVKKLNDRHTTSVKNQRTNRESVNKKYLFDKRADKRETTKRDKNTRTSRKYFHNFSGIM